MAWELEKSGVGREGKRRDENGWQEFRRERMAEMAFLLLLSFFKIDSPNLERKSAENSRSI